MRRLLLFPVVALVLASVALAGGGSPAPRLDSPPTGLAQSWLAEFHLSRHVLHVGDTVTGVVSVQPIGNCAKGHRCVKGAYWPITPGLEAKRCAGKRLVCTFEAVDETDGWQVMAVGIDNDVGAAHSDDYYIVIDKTRRVIEGTVTHPSTRKGIPGVLIAIEGRKSFVARTDASGFYSALLKKGSYSVSYTPPAKYVSRSRNHVRAVLGKTARANFILKERHRQLFHGVDQNSRSSERSIDAPVGSQIQYDGMDWDPHGFPIALSFGSKQLEAVPPTAERWLKTYTVEPYPDGTCSAPMRARQDDVVRTVRASAEPIVSVLFSDGDVGVKGGRRTKSGTFICEGEEFEAHPGSAAAFLSLNPPKAKFTGLQIRDHQRGVDVYGELYAPSVQIPLAGGKVVSIPGPSGGDLSGLDTAARPGVQVLPAETGPTTVTGYLRREGDLHVAGRLSLEGATIYVTGNVTIDGGLNGVGALIVRGSVQVSGDVALRSDGLSSIRADGPVVFLGA